MANYTTTVNVTTTYPGKSKFNFTINKDQNNKDIITNKFVANNIVFKTTATTKSFNNISTTLDTTIYKSSPNTLKYNDTMCSFVYPNYTSLGVTSIDTDNSNIDCHNLWLTNNHIDFTITPNVVERRNYIGTHSDLHGYIAQVTTDRIGSGSYVYTLKKTWTFTGVGSHPFNSTYVGPFGTPQGSLFYFEDSTIYPLFFNAQVNGKWILSRNLDGTNWDYDSNNDVGYRYVVPAKIDNVNYIWSPSESKYKKRYVRCIWVYPTTFDSTGAPSEWGVRVACTNGNIEHYGGVTHWYAAKLQNNLDFAYCYAVKIGIDDLGQNFPKTS